MSRRVPTNEVELTAAAQRYHDLQKLKQVKWFVARGQPLPTDDDKLQLFAEREGRLETNKRMQMNDDSSRRVAQTSNDVIVPVSKHPLYESEERALQRSKPSFAVPAASGIEGRMWLQQQFSHLCKIVLLRRRFSARYQKALLAQKGVSVATKRFTGDPAVVLMELPSILPAAESMSSSNSKQDAPSTSQIEIFAVKQLYTAFEYKLKGYMRQQFADHHFSNSDVSVDVPPLPAGPLETAEVAETVVAIEHFVQPLVTLETFAMPQCGYVDSTRFQGNSAVIGSHAQPVTCAGSQPPHFSSDFCHAQPSQHCSKTFRLATVQFQPLPLPLTAKRSVDELSDSDDDNDVGLPVFQNVQDVAAWLPRPVKGKLERPVQSINAVVTHEQTFASLNELRQSILSLVNILPAEFQRRF